MIKDVNLFPQLFLHVCIGIPGKDNTSVKHKFVSLYNSQTCLYFVKEDRAAQLL